MKFDSKIVIPTQFVLFNLSAIVGSAVLYGDFHKATFHQMMTFLYGCGATFAGVFMLTWGSAAPEEDLEEGISIAQTSAPGSPTMGRMRGGRIQPILRRRSSTVSLVGVGLSPAQRVLLVQIGRAHV